MKIQQAKCPKCELTLCMESYDELLYCPTCRAIHTYNPPTIDQISYEIAGFPEDSPKENRIYVPFWRILSEFHITSGDVDGGFFSKMGKELEDGGRNGSIYIYMPASQIDKDAFRYWTVNLTINNPSYEIMKDFDEVKRIPTIISQEDAIELTDFVVMILEAENPGILQHLEYSLTVNEAKMIYLPFITGSSGLHLVV
ncbi:MAG: hypothetical protein GX369_04125 [Euryarchaeota archaeon]|nr:hypothetical protein [Euryarchaeota archaeon]